MKRAPRDPEPAKRRLAFLRNHREAIAAMDPGCAPCWILGDHAEDQISNLLQASSKKPRWKPKGN